MKSVIALGMFDGMHAGHKSIICKAKQLAKHFDANVLVTTFSDKLFENGLKGGKCLFLEQDRVKALYQEGVDQVFVFCADQSFLQQSKIDFLQYLNNAFDLVAVVVGADFLFGKNKEGTAAYVKEFFAELGVLVSICDILSENGQKISSSTIKELIRSANFDEAERLLGVGYSVKGNVRTGRGDGAKNSVPTMNIDIPTCQVLPPNGVYYTHTLVDGVRYPSITNLGGHPTFDDETENIETHLLNTQGDFYGKDIEVLFCKKLRDIMRFDSPEELKKQIEQDIQEALNDKIWRSR